MSPRFWGRLNALHPEVHAEIDFGLENSLGTDSDEMTENLRVFDQHLDDWHAVEADIILARDKLTRADPPGAPELAASAGNEVAACLAAWQGEWDHALASARNVIDALRGGKAPQRYAALWNYLAACWSLQLARQTRDDGYRSASEGYYRAARAAGRGTTWLSHLAAPADQMDSVNNATEHDPLDLLAATNIAAAVRVVGGSNRFDADVTIARSGLLAVEAHAYEDALVHLGLLAGADPSDGDGGATAAPDATWIFETLLWVAWEAKSEAVPEGSSASRPSGRPAGTCGTWQTSATSRSQAGRRHC